MSATVLLKDIVDALEMVSDEFLSFLDLDTGEVETVHRELLGRAEECADDEEPDLPAWQDEEWEVAKRIVFSDRFRKLPTKFEVHQWAIMHVVRPGPTRRNVRPVCGNVRLFVGRWRRDGGAGQGIRRFFGNAAWDRKPHWRRDGDGSECGRR